MSEPAAWDDEDFEPELPAKGAQPGDKWDGEDEDDDVKDNWDDDDEEKSAAQTAVQVKKKKPIKDRIAEKEAKKKAEMEEQKRQMEEANKNLTPQALQAEKIRRQKLQEEADLKLACDAFGVSDNKVQSLNTTKKIDTFNPESKEDFETFENLLKEKITPYESSPYYVGFLENLYRTLAVSVEPEELKKLGSCLNTLANEKTKALKGKAKKKKGPKLVPGKEDYKDIEAFDEGNYGGEFDDFI